VLHASRHVEFEACFNFRDLGGYEARDGRHVRWNTLYRSDTLHRLTAADADTFGALGLRTVIDLRSQTEIDDHGRLAHHVDAVDWHNVAMLDNLKLAPPDPGDKVPESVTAPVDLAPGEGYVLITERYAEAIAQVYRLLSRDDAFPAVFHCTAGRDRTGIISAMTLDVLGVPDDVIADDYVLTEVARERTTAWIEANEPAFAAYMAQFPPERRVVRAETILGFLDGLRVKYGSVPGFLGGIGVGEDVLDGLRTRLLACGAEID
jgi:protein-tyrosine phosphatase